MRGVTLFADWDPKPDFKLGFRTLKEFKHTPAARFGETPE